MIAVSSSGGDAGAGRTQGDAGRAVGDPSLEFASWLPASGSYADFDGRLVELPPRTAGRAVTHVERGGEAVLIQRSAQSAASAAGT